MLFKNEQYFSLTISSVHFLDTYIYGTDGLL